jgi:hypothetical protein
MDKETKGMIRDVCQVAFAMIGVFLMLFGLAFLKNVLKGDWLAFAMFNLLFWSGTTLGFFGAISPMLSDFFEHGLGKVWLKKIEEEKN